MIAALTEAGAPCAERPNGSAGPRLRARTPGAPAAAFAAVLNVDAGGLSGRRLKSVARALRAAGDVSVSRILYTDGAGLAEALREAARLSPRAVLVCGGDGTARTALEILTPLGVPTAPLPGGTLNRLSAAVYQARTLAGVLRRIAHGGPDWIPAGQVAGRRFFVVSGFGAPMRLNAVRESVRAGRFGEAWRAWRAVAGAMFRERIEIGRPRQSATLSIVSLGPVDSAFGLAPARPRDGFEVASTEIDGWAAALSLAPFALAGGWRTRPNVQVGAARMVALRGPGAGLAALLDGEPALLPNEVAITYEERAGLVWR